MRLDQVANCYPVTLQNIDGGKSGAITVAEHGVQLPFDFKRVYCITGITHSATVRGRHAHKTLQHLFCMNGSVQLNLDDGLNRTSIVLDKPYEGIYLGL